MPTDSGPAAGARVGEPWWLTSFTSQEDLLRLHTQPADRTAAQVDLIESALALPTGARVVDLACGTGRHAVALAERGYQVTCVDLSADYLARAANHAAAHGVHIELLKADARDLAGVPDSAVDAVICMYSSFGYFTDERDNAAVLAEAARVLGRPYGALLLDVINRDWFVRNHFPSEFVPEPAAGVPAGPFVVRDYEEIDGRVYLHQNTFDPTTSRLRWTCRDARDPTRERVVVDYRMYSAHELLGLLHRTGLAPVTLFGDYDGTPYTLFAPRLLCVARVV